MVTNYNIFTILLKNNLFLLNNFTKKTTSSPQMSRRTRLDIYVVTFVPQHVIHFSRRTISIMKFTQIKNNVFLRQFINICIGVY